VKWQLPYMQDKYCILVNSIHTGEYYGPVKQLTCEKALRISDLLLQIPANYRYN
jgi:hypothetical protein